MSEKPIRWGILATGGIAKAFARALPFAPGAALVAVGSRSQAAADEFGDMFGIRKRHATYETLANDPEVDAVYVATPHVFHLANSVMCLRAGKAVLCEKAFTINAREAEELVRVAREEKRFLMEAMVTRHYPIMGQVRTWLGEGVIGDVRMVRASRCSGGVYTPEGRHMNLALGGGSLLDVGIYPLSFVSMVFGGQVPRRAAGYAHLGATGADQQGVVMLEYGSGAVASVEYALYTQGVDEMRVFGTHGMISVEPPCWGPMRAVLTLAGKEPVVVECPIEGNGLNYEAVEVMRCMREGLLESPVMPLDESVTLMQTMDTIRAPWGLRYPGE